MSKVLDKGSVELIDFMGGDIRTVAAARVSNAIKLKDASKGEDKDKGLLKYLLKHNHTSPFEHSVFTFYIKAPLFVFREWHRHRTQSYNEISGRYVEFEPEFYIPLQFRVPASTNKQGSILPEDNTGNWNWKVTTVYNKALITAYDSYKELLDLGVAKEMARMVIPLSLYSEMYATVDAHNLMKFLALRNAPDAQWEIQEYARATETIFAEKMPWTYEIWGALKNVKVGD